MPNNQPKPHRVAMVIYPDTQILDAVGPLEVFARTARWLAERGQGPAYSVELIGPAAGPVAMSSGVELIAARGLDDFTGADTLLISGGVGFRAACADARLLAFIKAQEGRVARLGSICTGAFILAAAGVLDGREATTHWAYLDEFARAAPGTRVDRTALYVQSGDIFTSAGVTAGIDLALALVESDFGKPTALAIAEALVVYRRRAANETQISRYLEAERRDDRIGAVELWMLDRLHEELSVGRLAGEAGMSARHFAREFKRRTGSSPAAHVDRLRVEEACRRLDGGAAQLKSVAAECGFRDEQTMRRAFQRRLGVVPARYFGDRA